MTKYLRLEMALCWALITGILCLLSLWTDVPNPVLAGAAGTVVYYIGGPWIWETPASGREQS